MEPRLSYENKAIKVLKENKKFFYNLEVRKAFLTMTQNEETIEEMIDKTDYIKVKKFWMEKNKNIKRSHPTPPPHHTHSTE